MKATIGFLSDRNMQLPWLAMFIILSLTKVTSSLYFNFSSFKPQDEADLWLNENSQIFLDAIQVTPDIRGPITNYSGRVFYKEQLKLRDSQRGTKTSFNSTFVFTIAAQTSPGGEGFAFILTDDTSLQLNSGGQWLGIVNSTSTGVTNIVAVEFDTRKSFLEDVDDNHVGVDVKNIYSIKQEPLGPHGVNLSSGNSVVATVYFDANLKKMTIFVSPSDLMLRTPVLVVEDIDLSEYLPEDVFVGFSASTGEYTQINAVRSWYFSSWNDIEKNPKINRTWLWILIPIVGIGGVCVLASVCFWRRQHIKGQGAEEDMKIELEIKSSSNAPHRFQLKELLSATRSFHSSNKLGKGGFGMVYKGTLNGKDVAVKRISKNSRPSMRTLLLVLTGEASPPFVAVKQPAFTWPATASVLNEEFNFQVTWEQHVMGLLLLLLNANAASIVTLSVLHFFLHCNRKTEDVVQS
ncbi:hypothetical protein VNO80_14342 [Phaseolus coccineus]|uniref:Legume lectin domain-containing protein n=1 Tax=Phaseolus coccineus TaxID=3886 RepID=A0AAN9R0T4_PHACN